MLMSKSDFVTWFAAVALLADLARVSAASNFGLTSAVLEPVFARAERPTRMVTVVTNIGPAQPVVQATLTLPTGVQIASPKVEMTHWQAGETRSLEWDVRSAQPERCQARLDVKFGDQVTSWSFPVCWHEARAAARADYVPPPEPVGTVRDVARPEAAFPAGPPEGPTMVEIAYLARRTKIPVRETLERLRDAGMDSLPGGGAEIFNERVRRIICDHKIDGHEWLETARAAHQLGLRSNCTMLYGHIENEEDRVDHLVRLRALAGRNARFRDLHPAGLPSRQHGAPAHPQDHRVSRTSRTSRWRG